MKFQPYSFNCCNTVRSRTQSNKSYIHAAYIRGFEITKRFLFQLTLCCRRNFKIKVGESHFKSNIGFCIRLGVVDKKFIPAFFFDLSRPFKTGCLLIPANYQSGCFIDFSLSRKFGFVYTHLKDLSFFLRKDFDSFLNKIRSLIHHRVINWFISLLGFEDKNYNSKNKQQGNYQRNYNGVAFLLGLGFSLSPVDFLGLKLPGLHDVIHGEGEFFTSCFYIFTNPDYPVGTAGCFGRLVGFHDLHVFDRFSLSLLSVVNLQEERIYRQFRF